jgi:hypothetical protein
MTKKKILSPTKHSLYKSETMAASLPSTTFFSVGVERDRLKRLRTGKVIPVHTLSRRKLCAASSRDLIQSPEGRNLWLRSELVERKMMLMLMLIYFKRETLFND